MTEMTSMPQAVPVVVPLSVEPLPLGGGGGGGGGVQAILPAPQGSSWLDGWLLDLDGGAGSLLQYAPAFRRSGFDSVPALASLTEVDLQQLGVLLGHRRVILAHLRGAGKARGPAAAGIPLVRPEPPAAMRQSSGGATGVGDIINT